MRAEMNEIETKYTHTLERTDKATFVFRKTSKMDETLTRLIWK